MIKAIFFDIDGTLISFATHRMPESTRAALFELRRQGVKLFIATGRSASQIDFIKEYFTFDGFLTMNGQYCYNDSGEIFKHPIPKPSLACLLPYLEEHTELGCGFVERDYAYFNRITPEIDALWAKLGSTAPPKLVDTPQRIFHHDTYQLSVYITKEQERDFLQALPDCRPVRWHPDFADIIPADGGKALGMKKILSHYSLTIEESMAFGDGGNDIDMLAAAGIGVAMGNADDCVKQAADYATTAPEQDGIANALRHFGMLP